jgi:hypothetical protein
MKIKLVIIDSHAGHVPHRMRYYIDTNACKHISRWQYSPKECSKYIGTDFSEKEEALGESVFG